MIKIEFNSEKEQKHSPISDEKHKMKLNDSSISIDSCLFYNNSKINVIKVDKNILPYLQSIALIDQ